MEKYLLIQHLIAVKQVSHLTEQEWELLLCQARSSGQMARLAYYAFDRGFFEVPDYVAKHFFSATTYFSSQSRAVQWELCLLSEALAKIQLPLVLLKGAAYNAAKLDASYGRVFNDIDILVPYKRLDEVKQVLAWSGWFPEKLDEYDQKYYQKWMHELPPMLHLERGTSLDIHHNILPIVSHYCPDAEQLYTHIIRVEGTRYWTLQPVDMILHSASHLFLNGEFENGLRDLTDMDLLLRQFSAKHPDFFSLLVERSYQLSLQLPLYFSLYYCRKILKNPVPEQFIQALNSGGLGKINKIVMDFLLKRALMPDHPSCDDCWTTLARWVLYVRSHWLRMPWYLLIPHLLRKSWLRLTGKAIH